MARTPGAVWCSGMSLRRVALFARFPHFRPRRPEKDTGNRTALYDEAGASVPLERATEQYPMLADDLHELQEIVMPLYWECDSEANLEQNRYRRQQVLLVIGGLVTSVFGAVQAAASGQVWPGLVVSAAAAASSAFASIGRQSGALDAYLEHRLRAERLRSLYFSVLAEPRNRRADDGV